MKKVYQKHENGCVIACVAMIVNKSYNDIYKMFIEIYGKPKMFSGLSVSQEQSLFFELDKITKTYYPNDGIKSLKNNSIISYRLPDGNWHAVVWDVKNKRILEPSKGVRAHSLSYIQKEWCI